METTVRCKFVCVGRKQRLENWTKGRVLFDYEFTAVQNGSEENKKFFAYTPCGKFEVSSVTSDQFEIGKEYYFDISAAPVDAVGTGSGDAA